MASVTERIFASYDEAGNITNTIVADSAEWCETQLGGDWAELTGHDTINLLKIDVASKTAYDALSPAIVGLPVPRQMREFAVWLAIPKTSIGGEMPNACSTTEYAIFPPSLVWRNALMPDATDPTDYQESVWKLAETDEDGVFSNLVAHHVLFDAKPSFALVLHVLPEEFGYVTEQARRTHPHITGANAHELLRVIYEWNWAHDNLGSDEPAALLAHDVWQHLDPPTAVIEAIETLRDMAVARFLKGEADASDPYPDDEPCPKAIADWWSAVTVPLPTPEIVSAPEPDDA